jgi:toxin ParE1/3/4
VTWKAFGVTRSSKWGKTQAERYLDELNSSFETLAMAPQLAPACDMVRTGYRRHRVSRHVVYYRLESATVIVVRVLHERMDAARHL